MGLQGYKTYLFALLIGLASAARYLGYLDEGTYSVLLGLLGAGTAATLGAKVNRVDKKLFVILPLFLLYPTVAFAQNPIGVPSSKLAWDQEAPTLAEAQSATYKLYADGSTTGVVLSGVTCVTGTSAGVFLCSASFPAFTPGQHRVTLTASNAAGESPKSLPFDFTFVVIPSAPRGLRIIGG